MSQRVSLVAAAAMQRSARDVLGVELSRDDATALARAGDLESALRDLERRLDVKRPYLSREENLSLSAQETALRQGGGSEAQVKELVGRTVEKAKSRRESERLAEGRRDELRNLVARYENESPDLRKFFRKAKRLWDKRAMAMKLTIPDNDRKRRAIDELSQLFTAHIDEALTSFGLRESDE